MTHDEWCDKLIAAHNCDGRLYSECRICREAWNASKEIHMREVYELALKKFNERKWHDDPLPTWEEVR